MLNNGWGGGGRGEREGADTPKNLFKTDPLLGVYIQGDSGDSGGAQKTHISRLLFF